MRPVLTLLVALAAALAVTAGAGPAGACAQTTDEPCLEDRATTWLRGTVFLDRGADGGVRGSSDPGRRYELVYVDFDGDAFPDPEEPKARTADDGVFALEVDPAAFPEGARHELRLKTTYGNGCTSPAPCVWRTAIVAGTDNEGQDFGMTTPAHLRGQANEDLDDDGVRDRDEPGALGLEIYLDVDQDKRWTRGEPITGVPFHGAWELDVPTHLLNRALTLRSKNPQGFHCKVPSSCAEAVLPLGAGEYREMGQRMISEPAIVFVHGFLGSEIGCPGNKLWFDTLGADLLDMQIAPDGRSNMTRAQGGTACSEQARPTGGLILRAAGSDIYGSTVDHYSTLARGERFRAIAWDWRKDPESQVHVLDRVIDDLRCEGQVPCDTPRRGKVVLVAHSQGGLLSRAYIADPARAAKVRRLVTVGTPTWGSPKAVFPLAGGIETPIGGPGMDIFLDNEDLKVLYRNLSGAFALLPSPAYGPWLDVPTFDSARMDADTAPDFLSAIGGNELLIRAQADTHRRIYDRYATNPAGVDYQVVAGKGMATIVGVRLVYGADERVEATFGDGDETVPLRSSRFDAPDDKVHFVCGISHVPLTADAQTTEMVDDFVAKGDPVKPNPRGNTDCSLDATVINVYSAGALGFDLTDPVGTASAATRIRVRARGAQAPGAGAGPRMTLEQAQRSGLIDLLQTATQTMIVVNNRTPVTIDLPDGPDGRPYTVTTEELDGARRSAPVLYGPFTKGTTVGTGSATTLRAGSRVVRPAKGAERRPPRTTARVTRLTGGRVRVALRARDASKVNGTFLFVGERRRRYRRPVVLTAAQARRASFASVDRWGNSEARRPLRVR